MIEDTYGPMDSFENEHKIGESVEDLYLNNLKDDMKLIKAISSEGGMPEKKWSYDTRDTKTDPENSNTEKKDNNEHPLVKRKPTYLELKPYNYYLRPTQPTELIISDPITYDSALFMKMKQNKQPKKEASDEDDSLYYHLNGEFYRLVEAYL